MSASAATAAGGGKKMLALSVGTNPAQNGMLTRGYFRATSAIASFETGSVVYMNTVSGTLSTIAPTGSGEVVRLLGHCGASADLIYFSPELGWVELA